MLEGVTESFAELAASCEETEGLIVDEATRQVLAPVPDTNETLYAGVQYGPEGVRYKVYSTAKDQVRAWEGRFMATQAGRAHVQKRG